MKNKNVLISGAGVAGLTLAYWLKQYGFIPTIVEKHPSLRTGGGSSWIASLSQRLMQILPARCIQFYKSWGLRQTTQAANAIVLKNYQPEF